MQGASTSAQAQGTIPRTSPTDLDPGTAPSNLVSIPGYEEAAAWYYADPSVAALANLDFLKRIFDDKQAQWAIWKEIIIYQGYNPRRIVTLMLERAKSYLSSQDVMTADVIVKIGGKDTIVTLRNNSSFTDDVQLIIELFGARGSTWQKLNDKSSKSVSTWLGWMSEKYNLSTDTKAAGTSLDPDLVTIPRIIGCFPNILCQQFHLGYGKLMFPMTDMGFGEKDVITKAVLTPFFCSLVPLTLTKDGNGCHFLHFLCHVLVDDIIHKKAKAYTNLEQMWQYYQATNRSEATPEAGRLKFCASLGMLDATKTKFLNVYIDADGKAEDLIKQLRPQDPDLKNVVAELRAYRG